jgi:hypothetical protein
MCRFYIGILPDGVDSDILTKFDDIGALIAEDEDEYDDDEEGTEP